jgi:outer membrane protein
MNHNYLLTLLAALGLSAHAFTADAGVGVVNFTTCVTDSKIGKQEQASFESLKNQMGSLLQETEKQLTEISQKFNDPEYMDGLSPEAEEEMKNKFRTLSEEMNRYQNQYYQVLNQANMRIMQSMNTTINTAAEKVAKDKHLTMVINKEACFFYSPQLEVTPLVIAEMDKNFEQDAKTQAAAAPAPAASKQETAKAESSKSEAKK